MLNAQERLDILALYAEYNRTIDSGDAAAWARTFAEDGVFQHPSRDFVGRPELEGFVRDRTPKLATHPCASQRHWNDAITVEDNTGNVTGSCQLIVWGLSRDTSKPEVIARGRYADELVKSNSGWRFRRRTLRIE